jgi:hypothetical protein
MIDLLADTIYQTTFKFSAYPRYYNGITRKHLNSLLLVMHPCVDRYNRYSK